MYAIKNIKTGEWLFGTDYREYPRKQRTSKEQALTYMDKESAKLDLNIRECGGNYEVVQVKLIEIKD